MDCNGLWCWDYKKVGGKPWLHLEVEDRRSTVTGVRSWESFNSSGLFFALSEKNSVHNYIPRFLGTWTNSHGCTHLPCCSWPPAYHSPQKEPEILGKISILKAGTKKVQEETYINQKIRKC